MEILQQKKVVLENYVATRKNPDSSSGKYPDTAKSAQWILVDKNIIWNEDTEN